MLVDQLNYFIPMNEDRVLFFKQQNRTFLFPFYWFYLCIAVVFTLKVEFAFKILFLFSSKLFSVKG